MAHKTLTISEEAYERLVKAKGSDDESFTKVIIRLTEGRLNISAHKGIWKGLDERAVQETFKEIRESWKRWKAR